MLCVDSLWHLNQSQEAAGAHTLVSPVAVSPRADLRETQELKSQVLCMRLKYVEMLPSTVETKANSILVLEF